MNPDEQIAVGTVLEEVAVHAIFHRLIEDRFVFDHGEHKDVHRDSFPVRGRGHAEPVQTRHAEVEQEQVRSQCAQLFQRFDTVFRLAHDVQPLVLPDDVAQAGTEDRMIVSNEYGETFVHGSSRCWFGQADSRSPPAGNAVMDGRFGKIRKPSPRVQSFVSWPSDCDCSTTQVFVGPARRRRQADQLPRSGRVMMNSAPLSSLLQTRFPPCPLTMMS